MAKMLVIHLAMVFEETGLWGFTYDTNNDDDEGGLKFSTWTISFKTGINLKVINLYLHSVNRYRRPIQDTGWGRQHCGATGCGPARVKACPASPKIQI